jgi:hypothetical protein
VRARHVEAPLGEGELVDLDVVASKVVAGPALEH